VGHELVPTRQVTPLVAFPLPTAYPNQVRLVGALCRSHAHGGRELKGMGSGAIEPTGTSLLCPGLQHGRTLSRAHKGCRQVGGPRQGKACVLGACRAGSSQAPEGLGTCIASTSPILSFVCIHLYTARLGPPGALGIRLGEMSCIPLIDQDDHLPQLISSGALGLSSCARYSSSFVFAGGSRHHCSTITEHGPGPIAELAPNPYVTYQHSLSVSKCKSPCEPR
jgi:hypothetical protein